MPRFCANISWLFKEHAPLDRVAVAMDAGFDGIEVQFPYADGSAADWARAVQAAGAGVGVINVPPGDLMQGGAGLNTSRARQGAYRDAVRQAVEYAAALGAYCVNVIGGPPLPDDSHDQAWGAFVENLAFAAEALAPHGVRVVTEPMNPVDRPDWVCNSLDRGLAAIDAAGHPALGIEFDLYHMQIGEGCALSALRRHLPRVGHVQIADFPGRHEPGTGALDFPAIYAALDQGGYAGWTGAEYLPGGQTGTGLAWLTQRKQASNI